jgi:hypothetical protein
MHYTCETTINLPINRVIELFDNPDNLSKWQPGLQSFEHLTGEPGEPGATSKLLYKMGKRTIEMIETVETRNLPHEFTGRYETPGVFNRNQNRFEAFDEHTTRWVSNMEFRFQSLTMKLMGWLSPGAFKKQTQKFMDLFKAFAEGEEATQPT